MRVALLNARRPDKAIRIAADEDLRPRFPAGILDRGWTHVPCLAMGDRRARDRPATGSVEYGGGAADRLQHETGRDRRATETVGIVYESLGSVEDR